jgi:hypothetical protein
MQERKYKEASEHEHQVSLVEWASLAQKSIPDLDMLAAIPNGGFRHKATAGKLKAEGVRAGYPDLVLNVPRGKYHGLFIELKSMTGSTSAAQKEWLAKLNAAGNHAVVCKGWIAAREVIVWYLAGAKDE